MSQTARHTIAYSKTKLVLALLGCVLLAAASAWMLTLDDATILAARRYNSPLIVHSLGVLGIILFGAGGLFVLIKLFDRSPGLVLDARGFTHRAGMMAFGFVPWSDVAGVDVYEVHRQKLLVVKLVDPQKYIRRGGAMRQALNRSNHRMCGSPITLSSNALAVDFDELRRLFWSYHSNRPDVT